MKIVKSCETGDLYTSLYIYHLSFCWGIRYHYRNTIIYTYIHIYLFIYLIIFFFFYLFIYLGGEKTTYANYRGLRSIFVLKLPPGSSRINSTNCSRGTLQSWRYPATISGSPYLEEPCSVLRQIELILLVVRLLITNPNNYKLYRDIWHMKYESYIYLGKLY